MLTSPRRTANTADSQQFPGNSPSAYSHFFLTFPIGSSLHLLALSGDGCPESGGNQTLALWPVPSGTIFTLFSVPTKWKHTLFCWLSISLLQLQLSLAQCGNGCTHVQFQAVFLYSPSWYSFSKSYWFFFFYHLTSQHLKN